jgi:hypothetical protein
MFRSVNVVSETPVRPVTWQSRPATYPNTTQGQTKAGGRDTCRRCTGPYLSALSCFDFSEQGAVFLR